MDASEKRYSPIHLVKPVATIPTVEHTPQPFPLIPRYYTRVSSNALPTVKPLSAYPVLLVLDANEERAQRLARLLTLANYRPIVATTPVQAFQRALQEPQSIQAIVLGRLEPSQHFFYHRLLQQLGEIRRRSIQILPMPASIQQEVPLIAHPSCPTHHLVSRAEYRLLNDLWRDLPATRSSIKRGEHTFTLEVLPAYGIYPRVSQQLLSRNSHFRQVLQAAYDLMSVEQWEMALRDVGLGQFRRMSSWPADDDVYAIPAEYLSYLNQAVMFSSPLDPVRQLYRWSDNATQASLQKKAPSPLMHQMLKLASTQQVMSATLKAFTREMNEIRGETLHEWMQVNEHTYWVVHYSNLYAYGRTAFLKPQPQCHVWRASLEATLRIVNLHNAWQVSEVECSCQTQTGHCLFAIQRRTQP